MKVLIRILTLSYVFLICSNCTDSSNHSYKNNFVDEYVNILDKSYNICKNINSSSDLASFKTHSFINQKEVDELKYKAKDYVLTDRDKIKLKEKINRLLILIWEKQLQFGGFSQEEIKAFNDEGILEQMLSASSIAVDNCRTLGDISGIN